MSPLGSEEVQSLHDAVLALVSRTAAHLLAAFEQLGDADVSRKGVVDLVTRLDLEAQAQLVAGLEARFPGEAILAEEGAVQAGVPERCWLVDPLDGTTNFVHGQPQFAVSVARTTAGVPDFGVTHAPYMREVFWAAQGHGAWLGERRLRTSRRPDLDAALLATGFPYDIRTNPHNNLREWCHLATRCRGLRRAGAASLDLAYVAAGRFDGFWEFRLKPWDLAAGTVLVREAGGRVTDPDGGSAFLWAGDILATNGPLHAPLCEALRRARS